MARLTSTQVEASAEVLPTVFGQQQRLCVPLGRNVFFVRGQELLLPLVRVIHLGSAG